MTTIKKAYIAPKVLSAVATATMAGAGCPTKISGTQMVSCKC